MSQEYSLKLLYDTQNKEEIIKRLESEIEMHENEIAKLQKRIEELETLFSYDAA